MLTMFFENQICCVLFRGHGGNWRRAVRVKELMEYLSKCNPDEEVTTINYMENGEYEWYSLGRAERFDPENEESPVVLVMDEFIGG